MNNYAFNPQSPGGIRARLSRRVTRRVAVSGIALAGALIVMGLVLSVQAVGHAGLLSGFGALILAVCIWLQQTVVQAKLAKINTTNRLDQLLPLEIVRGYRLDIPPRALWALIAEHWQTRFVLARFGIDSPSVEAALEPTTVTADRLMDSAAALCLQAGSEHMSVGSVAVALILATPNNDQLLASTKLGPSDLYESVGWLARLNGYINLPRPIYGGLARDWAAGFTPTLNQFTSNFSQQIESLQGHYVQQERTSQLDTLITALSTGNASVVLVGENGIGKTALLYGLAERLLRGDAPKALRHNQIVSLSASGLLSRVQGSGDLERIVLTILGEAIGAANIVVALDEAQLFFGQGSGAVNLSQILLPIVQNRQLKLALTLSPGDWQRLRSTNAALASLLTPIVLTEPDETSVMRLLADRSLIMERGGTFTTWQALQSAYRLSGRYDLETANPGRSLKLIEASMNYPDNGFITASSVERAIESQYGVKAATARTVETDALLHLEDRIHERMINQSRAVSVVASALRRARAGVANPKRPIGSFLFLGPTGVGKTELARSLAALYFGAEDAMIRLDMSEYQQSSDVSRLLATAATDTTAFLSRIRQRPFSLVLFDEIEKANPAILNLLLQLLDEGNLTDIANKPVSFKDAIIIATSNAGADEIRTRIEAGQELTAFEQEFTDQLISSGSFKPELLNRFDEIVLFRPLSTSELVQVVGLLVAEVNRTLMPQKVTVELAPEAATALVTAGYDPRLGARPMRRMVQRTVEDAVAGKILRGEAPAGTVIQLGLADLHLPKVFGSSNITS